VLAEARLGFPPQDVHVPSAINMLAEFYRNTKQFDAAAALYQEVRRMRGGAWVFFGACCDEQRWMQRDDGGWVRR